MKKGLKTLLAGVVVFIGGAFAVPMALILPLVWGETEEEQFVVPGTAVVEIEEPGRYYLWNDYQTVFEGRSFKRSEAIPDGLEIRVVGEDGKALEFASDTSTSWSSGSSSRNSIGYVDVGSPGPVTVSVSGGSEERVFSFSEFHFAGMMKRFLTAFVAAMLLAVAGMGIAIWGIVKLVRK